MPPAELVAVDPAVLRASFAGAAEVLDSHGSFTPRRLPESALVQRVDDNIRVYSALATGVRLRLLTSAARLRVRLLAVRPVPLPDADVRGPVLHAEADERLTSAPVEPWSRRWVDATMRLADEPVREAVVVLELGRRTSAPRAVTLWLPHDAEVVLLGVDADAPVLAARPETRARWLHHGSSISHALDAPGPFGPWPQQVARDLGADLTNLSIAGQAVLDGSVARTIAALPADVITLKLGINIVNCDGFGRRTLTPALHSFLDLVRDGHPDTPVVVITAISCPIHEHTPGPTIAGPDGRAMPMPRERHPRDQRLTLTEVRTHIEGVVAQRAIADPRLALLDGRELFGPNDAHLLPDNLHPSVEGNDLIARRFAALARDPASALGRAFAEASRQI